MSKFIQNLRRRSSSERKRLALAFSASVAGVAFLVFITLFIRDFNAYSDMKAAQPKTEGALSKVSKSYDEYKRTFDESDLAERMESIPFSKNDAMNATITATTTIGR